MRCMSLGLIQGVKGKKVANGQNKPSKMWATEELIDLLQTKGGTVFIKSADEVIYLKDANKIVDKLS